MIPLFRLVFFLVKFCLCERVYVYLFVFCTVNFHYTHLDTHLYVNVFLRSYCIQNEFNLARILFFFSFSNRVFFDFFSSRSMKLNALLKYLNRFGNVFPSVFHDCDGYACSHLIFSVTNPMVTTMLLPLF